MHVLLHFCRIYLVLILLQQIALCVELKDKDFVYVIGSSYDRIPLVQSWFVLRNGSKTLVTVDEKLNGNNIEKIYLSDDTEYVFWPPRNSEVRRGSGKWQGAPFLAHMKFKGTYKWMLIGDDNTLWMPYGVRRIVSDLDPNLPYAISDHFEDRSPDGESFFSPSSFASVCLPCRQYHSDMKSWKKYLVSSSPSLLMSSPSLNSSSSLTSSPVLTSPPLLLDESPNSPPQPLSLHSPPNQQINWALRQRDMILREEEARHKSKIKSFARSRKSGSKAESGSKRAIGSSFLDFSVTKEKNDEKTKDKRSPIGSIKQWVFGGGQGTSSSFTSSMSKSSAFSSSSSSSSSTSASASTIDSYGLPTEPTSLQPPNGPLHGVYGKYKRHYVSVSSSTTQTTGIVTGCPICTAAMSCRTRKSLCTGRTECLLPSEKGRMGVKDKFASGGGQGGQGEGQAGGKEDERVEIGQENSFIGSGTNCQPSWARGASGMIISHAMMEALWDFEFPLGVTSDEEASEAEARSGIGREKEETNGGRRENKTNDSNKKDEMKANASSSTTHSGSLPIPHLLAHARPCFLSTSPPAPNALLGADFNFGRCLQAAGFGFTHADVVHGASQNRVTRHRNGVFDNPIHRRFLLGALFSAAEGGGGGVREGGGREEGGRDEGREGNKKRNDDGNNQKRNNDDDNNQKSKKDGTKEKESSEREQGNTHSPMTNHSVTESVKYVFQGRHSHLYGSDEHDEALDEDEREARRRRRVKREEEEAKRRREKDYYKNLAKEFYKTSVKQRRRQGRGRQEGIVNLGRGKGGGVDSTSVKMDSMTIKMAFTTVGINTTSNANQSENIKDKKRGTNSHIANNNNKSSGSQRRANVYAEKHACEKALGDDECRWIASHAVSLEVRGKGTVSSFPDALAAAATATASAAAASNFAEEEEVKTLVQAYLHALPSLHRVDMAALEREWNQLRQQRRWRRTGGDPGAMPAEGEEGWKRREEGEVGEAAAEEEGEKGGREGEETDKNQKDSSEEERGWGTILGGKFASGSEL